MGRYTSVQTFTDKDGKVGTVPHTDSLAAATEDKQKVEKTSGDDKFQQNRVDNVAGSSAGAGSGDFHMYRASRRR